MKTFKELQEGVYDPNIFKAFFLAGGPGSGKSYVVARTTAMFGMRIVNSDDVFEQLIRKAGMNMDMSGESITIYCNGTQAAAPGRALVAIPVVLALVASVLTR